MKPLLCLKILLLLVTSCVYKSTLDSNFFCKKLKLSCIQNNRIAYFKTSKGEFEVKLDGKNNPVTVSNFIRNIKKNMYKNKRFYKIINFPQVQVIHSGISSGNNFYKNENQTLNKYRRNIPLEIKLRKEIEPKYRSQILDPLQVDKLINVFEKGSLAMVKSGKRNSSSTEFFFVTNKFPELDGRYSIFGKVVRGIEILNKINKEDLIYEIIISD